jgi:hypothetical protein
MPLGRMSWVKILFVFALGACGSSRSNNDGDDSLPPGGNSGRGLDGGGSIGGVAGDSGNGGAAPGGGAGLAGRAGSSNDGIGGSNAGQGGNLPTTGGSGAGRGGSPVAGSAGRVIAGQAGLGETAGTAGSYPDIPCGDLVCGGGSYCIGSCNMGGASGGGAANVGLGCGLLPADCLDPLSCECACGRLDTRCTNVNKVIHCGCT